MTLSKQRERCRAFPSMWFLFIRKTGRCSASEPLPAHSMDHLEHKGSRPKKRDSVGVPSPSRGVNKGKCWTTVITHDSKIAHHLPTWRKAPEACENAGKNNGFRDGPFVVLWEKHTHRLQNGQPCTTSSYCKWTLKTGPGVFPWQRGGNSAFTKQAGP